MFWRWNKDEDEDEEDENDKEVLEIPPLDTLEEWVGTLIVSLDLEPGSFTFLPAYGGILLFIRSEGIIWIPYDEIKELMGNVDKGKLAESTAMIGGAAAVASGSLALPVLLVPRFLKSSYRVIAQPSPKKSISFLNSMIDEIVIEEKQLNTKLLDSFEEIPFKENTDEEPTTHVITIYRKFFDDLVRESIIMRFVRGIVNFVSNNSEPVFAIPPQAEVLKFKSILEDNGINVSYYKEEELDELPESRGESNR